MIFHFNHHFCCALIKNVSKVDLWWIKSNSVNRKAAQDMEFNWQYLVSTCHFDRNFHSEIFKFIFWCLFAVLLHQVSRASLQNRSIGPELQPNFKLTISLNVSQSRVELKIWLEILGEEKLDLHGVCRSVKQDNFLSVELFIDQDVQVILFFFNINRGVNALTLDGDGNRFGIVLVFEKQGKILVCSGQFVRDESHLNFCITVTFNLSCSFEGNLSQELFKFNLILRKSCDFSELLHSWILLLNLFRGINWLLLCGLCPLLSVLSSFSSNPCSLKSSLSSFFLLNFLRCQMLFPLSLLLLPLPQIIHTKERYGPSIISLNIYFGSKCPRVIQF